jgi:hypothetical protein
MKFDEAQEKLTGRALEDQLKLIYEWTKTGAINLHAFTRLIKHHSRATQLAGMEFSQLVIECLDKDIDHVALLREPGEGYMNGTMRRALLAAEKF